MEDARALYREGFQHFVNDRLDEAIECYERAIQANPELAIAWNGLSMAFRQKGDLDRAIEAAQRLIELEPDDALSHTNLSILLQNKGIVPEAEEAMATATRLQMKQGG